MAGIRGDRKSGSGWLIWLLLFLLSALAVWWLAATREVASGQGGDVADVGTARGATSIAPVAGPAIATG